MAIKIITDSTSYLSTELLNEYDISVVSLSVYYDGVSYLETQMDLNDFYNRIPELSSLPTSSQPSLDSLYQAFLLPVKKGDKVIAIFLSSEMSGTYNSALMAKNMVLEEYPNAQIEIFDSRTNCMEMGFLVLEAAKAATQNKNVEEILSLLTYYMQCTRFLFVPSTLEYLKKGGRIGNASSLLAELLKIKPVLTVKEGFTTTRAKIRTQKKALDYILTVFSDDQASLGLENVVIHHIHCPEEALAFAQRVQAITGFLPQIVSIGGVIGTHVGPGTIGIAYQTKNPLTK